ncbi:MAG: nucleotidyltransferase domain-containing protein [Acidobacteria bacterium]|nr:nucleotidyltransferase domain-containing protein [Acidobacteriota bacterium]
MRLSVEEIETIKNSVAREDPEARVYLFGSRVDDNALGGDIDLLIESRIVDREGVRRIRTAFFARFGEQKLDMVVNNGEDNQPFIRMIRQEAVEL